MSTLGALYAVALLSVLATLAITLAFATGWRATSPQVRVMCALMLPGMAINLALLVRRILLHI